MPRGAGEDGVVVDLATGLGAPGDDPAGIAGVLLRVVLADVVADGVVAQGTATGERSRLEPGALVVVRVVVLEDDLVQPPSMSKAQPSQPMVVTMWWHSLNWATQSWHSRNTNPPIPPCEPLGLAACPQWRMVQRHGAAGGIEKLYGRTEPGIADRVAIDVVDEAAGDAAVGERTVAHRQEPGLSAALGRTPAVDAAEQALADLAVGDPHRLDPLPVGRVLTVVLPRSVWDLLGDRLGCDDRRLTPDGDDGRQGRRIEVVEVDVGPQVVPLPKPLAELAYPDQYLVHAFAGEAGQEIGRLGIVPRPPELDSPLHDFRSLCLELLFKRIERLPDDGIPVLLI